METTRGRESQSSKKSHQSPKESQANITLVNKKRQSGRLSSLNKRPDSRGDNQLRRIPPTCDIYDINYFKSKKSKVYILTKTKKAP